MKEIIKNCSFSDIVQFRKRSNNFTWVFYPLPLHSRAVGNFKKSFIAGLAILLPLAIAVACVEFIVNFLTQPFVGIVSLFLESFPTLKHDIWFFSSEKVILYTSKVVILILLFVFTIFIGMLTRWFAIRFLLNLGDKILNRIPLFNTVYKTTRDLFRTLFSPEKNAFKQVVLVRFPTPNIYALALIASSSPEECCKKVKEDLITVLIPTTPNPMSGFLLMYPQKDLIYVDMTPEDAIKYIVSCGIITPENAVKVPL